MEDRFVTTTEAANILETSEYHTVKLLEAGRLTGYKLFGEWRVSLEAIKKRIAERKDAS